MQGNIYLIGLMGSGKTTVGRKLASLMKMDFVDCDQSLEKRTGVAISYIFEVEGEQGFRDREAKMLLDISQNPPRVVSTGGGVILRSDNRSVMKQTGKVIYLRASFGILWKRLKGCQKRPLLQGPNPQEKIKQLIAERGPVYSGLADITVDVSSESATKMARKIYQKIQDHEQR